VNEPVAERVIRALVVGLMNGRIYFSKHHRVTGAAKEAMDALESHFEEHPLFQIHIRDNLLIFDGKPLYDLSIYAHQFIKAIRKCQAFGITIRSAVKSGEIIELIELLLKPDSDSDPNELNLANIVLEDKPVVDQLEMNTLQEDQDAGPVIDPHQENVSRAVYTEALTALQDIMLELRQNKQVSIKDICDMAENLAMSLGQERDSFIALTSAKDYDAYTFNHSVNVCIYAAVLAECMTTSQKNKVRIAQAAMLHDVGKLLIPDEVLHKTGIFSQEDREIMNQHTILGAKILMESDGNHELSVNVAFGHHLRYDRQGFPNISPQSKVDPVVDMINVIDFYEAITAKRPYKEPFPPEKATAMLLQGAGTQFHPVFVEAFITYFGAFPVSTRVILSNGAKGMVKANNPEAPFRPKVQITHDPEDQPVQSGVIVDTSEKSESDDYPISVIKSIPNEFMSDVEMTA